MIDKKIEQYCISHSTDILEILREIERYTQMKVQMPQMISGEYQGQFLSFISKLKKPKQILEIGTFTGYSAICLHQGLEDDGMLTTIDINKELEDDVKAFFDKANVLRRTNYIIGNALEIIPALKETYDLVFLDADKKNYVNYLELIIPDNVLWKGKVCEDNKSSDTEAIDLFNKQLYQHPLLNVFVLPIRDGVSLAIKI
jgi:predicted O-methyltransferase YrrM